MEGSRFTHCDTGSGRRLGIAKRTAVLGFLSYGLLGILASAASADKLSCPPVQRMAQASDTPPANKKIGVSVAYLKVPFYANFKTGLEDGAKQFGFTYDLVDGNSGDVAAELRICRILSPRNAISSSSRRRARASYPASSKSTTQESRSSKPTTRPGLAAKK